MKFTYYKLAIIGFFIVFSMDFTFSRRIRRRKAGPNGSNNNKNDDNPLTGVDSHIFNIHEYAETHPNTLLDISLEIFHAENLIGDYSEGKIPEKDLINIITRISKGYHKEKDRVYYHTALHAADAMQTIYTYFRYIEGGKATDFGVIGKGSFQLEFLKSSEQESPKLEITPAEKISIYFALAGHDYGHMGIENRCYQVLYKDDIMKYQYSKWSKEKEFSLEKFHSEQVIKILEEEGFFNNMKMKEKRSCDYLRNLIKAAIERTDGRYPHEKNLVKFTEGFRPEDLKDEDRIDLFAFLVHAADVSNPSKFYGIYIEWAVKVLKEFMRQGLIETEGKDKEKFQNLFNLKVKDESGQVLKNKFGPIPTYAGMNFPDETKTVLSRQKAFIDYVVDTGKGGFLDTLESIFPSLGYFAKLARYNRKKLEAGTWLKDIIGQTDLQLIAKHQLDKKGYDEVPSLDQILKNIEKKK